MNTEVIYQYLRSKIIRNVENIKSKKGISLNAEVGGDFINKEAEELYKDILERNSKIKSSIKQFYER